MPGLFAAITLSTVLAASGDARDQRLLLLLVPEDAAAAVYVEDAAEAVSSPLGAWGVGRMAGSWSAAAALPAALRGMHVPAVVVVTGDPAGQKEPVGVLVGLDLSASSWQPESFVDERLLPAIGEAAGTRPVVRRDGLLSEIAVEGWSSPCFWTSRGRQLLVSSDRQMLSGVLEGKWPQSKLVLCDEYRALSERLEQRGAVWAYASLPKFYYLARSATAEDPFLQRVYFLLGVENFRAMALEANSLNVGTRLRAAFRVENDGKGVLKLLGAAATRSGAIDLLPPATSGLLRMAVSDLRASIGAVNGLIEQIAPEVVKEFDGERANFKRDVGFDPLDDFAANIRDEFVIARVGGAGHAPALVLVAAIDDTARLADHMVALAGAFRISWRQRPAGAFMLYEPEDSQLGFAYGVGRGQLLIAQRAETIETVISRPTTTAAARGQDGFRRVVAGLPSQTRLMVVVPWPDVAKRVASWLDAFLPVDLPALPLATEQTSHWVGLSVNLDAERRRMVVDVVVVDTGPDPQEGSVRASGDRAAPVPP